MIFNINFILTVLIQVLCVFTFLTVFFFTYASKKEGEIVKSQVDFLTKDFLGTNIQLLPEDTKKVLLSKVNEIEADTSMNAKINKSNQEIKDKTYKLLAVAASVISFITLLSYLLKNKVSFFKDINLMSIFKETAIILFFVAITEFIFLEYFAARYISVQPNLVKAKILRNLATFYQN
jgi:hypothetical protein